MDCVRRFCLALIQGYQYVSRYLRPRCRFYPSCSAYAKQAILSHNLMHALALIIKRLWRCRPDQPCDIDEVPKREDV